MGLQRRLQEGSDANGAVIACPTNGQGFHPEKQRSRDRLQDDASNRGTTPSGAVVIAAGRLSPGESRPSCVPTSWQSTIAIPGPAFAAVPPCAAAISLQHIASTQPPSTASQHAAASRTSIAPSGRPRACHPRPQHHDTARTRGHPSSRAPLRAIALGAALLAAAAGAASSAAGLAAPCQPRRPYVRALGRRSHLRAMPRSRAPTAPDQIQPRGRRIRPRSHRIRP